MTREKAIRLLTTKRAQPSTDYQMAEVYTMAIQALSQEPCEDWYDVPSDEMTLEQARRAVKDLRKKLANYLEQEPCDDVVSRQAVIYYIKGYIHEIITESGTDKNAHTNSILKALINGVETMPTVNPQPCDDAISREAAINIASLHCLTIDETVKALKQLPSVTQKSAECDDAISRDAVINLIRGCNTALEEPRIFDCHNAGVKFEQYITELPSVTRQTGKWILLDECANSGYYCSRCQKKLVKEGWSDTVKKIKFCPNCGAKMFEPQERGNKE